MRTIAELVEQGVSLVEAEAEFRREMMLAVLKACGYDQCKAAAALGVHRNTLDRHMDKCEISVRSLKYAAREAAKGKPRACLTDEQKSEIRESLRAGESRKALAARYGVSYGYIVRIGRGIGAALASLRRDVDVPAYAFRHGKRLEFVQSITPVVPKLPVRKVLIAGRWVDDPRQRVRRVA